MNTDLLDILVPGLFKTLFMLGFSTLIGVLLGLPLGVVLVVTGKGHILEAPRTNKVLGTIVNATRSFPSLILIIVLLPLSRFLVGTTLGVVAALVPLSVGAAPFIARVFESSLKEVARGKIEASVAMGASPAQTIFKVLLPEALPSLVRGATISVISILGLTAIAGAIGAGGLGSIAIRYGYQRFRDDILLITVILLILLVQGMQYLGDGIARHICKRRHIYE